MLDGCHQLKRPGYWPGHFHQEVANIGGVQTVQKLLAKDCTSEPFAALWMLQSLDLGAEVFVLLPCYEGLFGNDGRRKARERLESNGTDVNRFLSPTATPCLMECHRDMIEETGGGSRRGHAIKRGICPRNPS